MARDFERDIIETCKEIELLEIQIKNAIQVKKELKEKLLTKIQETFNSSDFKLVLSKV